MEESQKVHLKKSEVIKQDSGAESGFVLICVQFLGVSSTVLQYLNSELEEWGGGWVLIQLLKASRLGKEARDSRKGEIAPAKWGESTLAYAHVHTHTHTHTLLSS